MLSWIKSFFESKLIHILADFHNLVADLKAHAEQELAKAEQLKGAAVVLLARHDVAVESAQQAQAVAARITGLVG